MVFLNIYNMSPFLSPELDEFENPELEKEFNDFMKSLQSGGEDNSINQLTNMMGELFKNMGGPTAESEEQKGDADPEVSKKLNDIFTKFEKAPQFDNFANKLLHDFMDKEILEEPLKDAKKSYETYLTEQSEKLGKEEVERFRNQEKCIDELITTLDKEPNNKDKLISLFEKMQEFGAPPEEITKNIEKDNPFKMFQNMQEMGGDHSTQNSEGLPPNMNMDNCRLF